MTFYIYPFKRTSDGAKLLKSTIKAEWIDDGERAGDRDVVINWGNGYHGTRPWRNILNKGRAIMDSVHKINMLKRFDENDISTYDWTTYQETVKRWLKQGDTVYAREIDYGCDGAGITVLQGANAVVPYAMLYGRRFPAVREFRVNVAFGKAIDVCEKKRRSGTSPDPLVRCGEDWVYCRNNLADYPDELPKEAAKAIPAVGLDFGGVDVGLSADGRTCVFEVNTAPWLGTVIAHAYKEAFDEFASKL